MLKQPFELEHLWDFVYSADWKWSSYTWTWDSYSESLVSCLNATNRRKGRGKSNCHSRPNQKGSSSLFLLPLFFHFLFSLSLPLAKRMSLDLEEETPSGSSTYVAKDGKPVPMDLLDEYWFFHNTLDTRRLPPRPPPSPNRAKESGLETSIQQQARLVSTPEIPSEDGRTSRSPPPRVGLDEAGREEVAVPSESSNPKLRHSFSSLDDRHRPQYSASSKVKEQASPLRLGLIFVWLVLGMESDASFRRTSLHLPNSYYVQSIHPFSNLNIYAMQIIH